MKKNSYLLFAIIVVNLVIGVVNAEECVYKYAYSEYYVGREETQNKAKATLKLEMPSKKGTVSEKAVEHALCIPMEGFDFSEEAELKNWDKETCPLYIAAYAQGANWYGFDEKPDLTFLASGENKKLHDLGIHIFLNESPPEFHYTCNYSGFSITYDKDGKAIFVQDKLSTSTTHYSYNLDSSLTEFPAVEPGVCENVYTCLTDQIVNPSPGISMYSYNVYSSNVELENKKTECLEWFLFPVVKFELESEEAGDNSQCRTIGHHFDRLRILNNECTEDKSRCVNYYKYKANLKAMCGSITKYADYDDACLLSCLNLNKLIANIENKDSKSSTCDFSERLLAWVSNILRWIKYILPVLVIVLGILDFMKAIGADKDDEMKKAQKRFVTRLIAAALVFIIPLIIEFVLNKMGFGYDSCGLF